MRHIYFGKLIDKNVYIKDKESVNIWLGINECKKDANRENNIVQNGIYVCA